MKLAWIRRRRRPIAIAFAAVVLAAPTAAGAATGTGADFGPDAPLTQLHVRTTQLGMVTTLHWKFPDRFREFQVVDLDPVDDKLVIDRVRGTRLLGTGTPGALHHVVVTRDAGIVTPDAYEELDGELMDYAWPLIARVRSGGAALTPVMLGTRATLRGTTVLAANDCAGLTKGLRTTWLDAKTLVPVRVIERRGRRVERDIKVTFLAPRASDFAALVTSGRRSYRSEGFVRRTPAAAAALVSYPVLMPSTVPAGFTFGHAGTNRLGSFLGPEASFPRSAGVFYARWNRGLEPLDLTIRPARATLAKDWDESDPFGGECASVTTTDTTVGSHPAKYATGEFGSPRLWWRDGTTLFTLSGPLSASQLVEVASTLAVVPE